MATREEFAVPPIRASRAAARRAATGTISLRQRIFFVIALIVFGASTFYTGVELLAHVSPALFPGKNILNLPGFSPLEAIGVSKAGANSVYNRRINLLIMGIDERPTDPNIAPANTDTIMVASIDPISKQMSILSIPRDLWVNIHPPGQAVYQERINTSWAVGLQQTGNLDGAAKQLQTDLQDDFGISTDYWLLLNFRGTEQLIQDIGGVDVNIPPDLTVPLSYYSDDDIHAQLIQFNAGPQHLDGYHAVAFGRYRNTDSDLYRIKRQQLVLSAALKKVLSTGLLNNPISLWNDYQDLIKTNIPISKMPGFGLLMKDSNPNLKAYSLGDPVNGVDTVTDWVTPGGADVLLPNMENVQYWVNEAFPDVALNDSHVEVRNGTGAVNPTLDTTVGQFLHSKGLSNVDAGPDQPTRPSTTIDVYGSSWTPLGLTIAGFLGLPPSSVVTHPDTSGPDVIVTIAPGFQLPGSGAAGAG